MSELSPEDFAFADLAVRQGYLTLGEIYGVLRDAGGETSKREDEPLGLFLVRLGLLTVEQLYRVTLAVAPPSENPETSSHDPRRASRRDLPYGVVLSGLKDDDRKDRAAFILSELRKVSLEQARVICGFPVVPAMTRLSREEAEDAKRRFVDEGIDCRIVKWKRQTAPSGRLGQKRSGRLRRKTTNRLGGKSETQSRVAGTETRHGSPSEGHPPSAARQNPFAQPVQEMPARDLSNTDSVSVDSVDFLVVGSNESDVIFLDGPADDNTATAITVFNESAFVDEDSVLESKKSSDRREAKIGPGSIVGGFRLISLLGKGGFAKVYLGEHTVLGHKAAVKVYSTRDAKLLGRITRREATLIARLRHPRLVSILNVGQEAGAFFIVMEYVEGVSVAQHVKTEGLLSPHAAATVARDVSEALHFVHRNGLVHRDIKPSNFLIEPDGRARLLDFELIKSLTEEEDQNSDPITQSGQLIGTPRFMSPEQIDDAKHPPPSSDIWSLGASLYYMVTGCYPFTGKSLIQIIKQVLVHHPAPVSEIVEGFPADFERLIMDMLSKDVSLRPQTMVQVIERLESLKLPRSPTDSDEHLVPATKRLGRNLPSASGSWHREPTDTVMVGSELGFVGAASEDRGSPIYGDELESDGSTVVAAELQIGKVDNKTHISDLPDETGRDDVLLARKWEDFEDGNVSEQESFYNEIPGTLKSSPALAAAREWYNERRASQLLELVYRQYHKRNHVGARHLLDEVFEWMPENREASELRQILDRELAPDIDRLCELARNGEKQLFDSLQDIIEAHVPEERVKEYLTRHGGLESGDCLTLKDFLNERRAAIWQHHILDELFDRAELRRLVEARGGQVTRRAPKRRLIATLLETMGFVAESIWR